MLHSITHHTDKFFNFIADDPVRPEISAEFRVSHGRIILALTNAEIPNEISAMICISFHNSVPEDVAGLANVSDSPTTVVFYSIWSYKPGAGRELLQQAVKHIKEHYSSVTTFVTLSPLSEMARRFHLKNGATVYRTNTETVNYLYS